MAYLKLNLGRKIKSNKKTTGISAVEKRLGRIQTHCQWGGGSGEKRQRKSEGLDATFFIAIMVRPAFRNHRSLVSKGQSGASGTVWSSVAKDLVREHLNKLDIPRSKCCHSEGPQQAVEVGWQESPEVQLRDIQSQAPGWCHPVQAREWLGKQLCGEGSGSPGGLNVGHEAAMCLCGKEEQQHHRLH